MERVDVNLPPSVSKGRVKTTIRVDESTWVEFQGRVKELGLSTCFVLEQLMRLFNSADQDQIPLLASGHLHLHVNYNVDRPRRYPRE